MFGPTQSCLEARLDAVEDNILRLAHLLDAIRRELDGKIAVLDGKIAALDAKIDRTRTELIGILSDRTRIDLLAAQSLNEDRFSRVEKELRAHAQRLSALEAAR